MIETRINKLQNFIPSYLRIQVNITSIEYFEPKTENTAFFANKLWNFQVFFFFFVKEYLRRKVYFLTS